MESHIHHESRIVWTDSHVLWFDKLPSYFSDDDEHHLYRWNGPRVAHDLYAWHGNSHRKEARGIGHTTSATAPATRQQGLISSTMPQSLLKPKKCEFEKHHIDFLGIRIQGNQVFMEDSKVEKVANWKSPTDICGVWEFLGFTGYYQQFIKDYSKIAQPLLDLTKTTTPWH